jgi:uncharacterized protein (TIGR03435 family)
MIGMDPTGTFTASGTTLKVLVQQAFGVRDFQISGGPSWVNTERWDLKAKPDGPAGQIPPAQLQPMLRGLLEERFQLQTHRESKEMPVYELILAKGGSKLQANRSEPGPGIRMGRGELTGKKVTVALLMQVLSQQVGRTIVDKTGLTGEYDFSLNWTPEVGQGGGQFGSNAGGPTPPPPSGDGATIFTALQEQLGLKLEAAKGPVEMIVIDKAERPSDN